MIESELPGRVFNEAKNFVRCRRNAGARAENSRDAGIVQEVVVLGWDDAAANHLHVTTTLLAQLLNESWHQRLVASSLARRANNVHVRVNCLEAKSGGAQQQQQQQQTIKRWAYVCAKTR